MDSEINADYKWDDLESDVKAQVNAFLNTAVGRNYASQMSFVRNHLEQTLADSFVDNTFFSEYEELAGTKSLRNYNKNTELNQEITFEFIWPIIGLSLLSDGMIIASGRKFIFIFNVIIYDFIASCNF